MRCYISVDMEGVAGIAHGAQVTFEPGGDRTDYDRSRSLMAGEANAAVAAAFEAGATSVVVNDSHWRMRNLRAEEIDPRARLIIGDKPYSMTQDVDGADLAAFIGYHAGAGHPTGILAHTYAGVVWQVRVDDVPHNEAALNALRLGHRGIPVALVAGDDALAGEVEALLPWAERVVVKRALSPTAADSLAPSEAQAAIAAGMRRALARCDEMSPYRPAGPLRLEVDLRLAVMADYCAVMPGVERTGPRTVLAEPRDAEELYRYMISIVRMASIPG